MVTNCFPLNIDCYLPNPVFEEEVHGILYEVRKEENRVLSLIFHFFRSLENEKVIGKINQNNNESETGK